MEKAHLGEFGSFKAIVKAKSELYDFIRENRGTVFVHANDELQLKQSEGINRILFGNKDNLSFSIKNISKNEFVSVKFKGKEIKSKLIGSYNFGNIAFACCVASFFGVPIEDISIAIESYKPSNNRSQIIDKNGKKIILDAYNANPSSMKAAILNFVRLNGEKTAILGDMKELGIYSKSEHSKMVKFVESQPIDHVLLVGDSFYKTKNKNSNIMRFPKTQDLIIFLKKNILESKIILIKGSRSIELEQILPLI